MNSRLVEDETEVESNYLESQLRAIHQHGKPPGTFWLFHVKSLELRFFYKENKRFEEKMILKTVVMHTVFHKIYALKLSKNIVLFLEF